jgi:hypothetical protein
MEVRVCGIMTCPRYSLTLSRNYIDRAFKDRRDTAADQDRSVLRAMYAKHAERLP